MNARDFALFELDAKHLPAWKSDLVKPRYQGPKRPGSEQRQNRWERPTDPRDVALAEQLVVGVVKNVLALQHLMQHYSGRSLKSIDPLVQKIVAIGLYQLRFLTRIPASAAVDEAVEQARRFGRTRAAGFVNAVLRKAATPDPSPLPTRDKPADYARLALSHPGELFRKLSDLLGVEDALRFCEHDQLEPPTILRLMGNDPAALAGEGIEIRPHEQSAMHVVEGARKSQLADWSDRGIAQVQDPTSASIIPRAGITPGMIVLDRCCGMGTKTIQMRDRVGETGRVVAVDPAEGRCQALRRVCERRGFANVAVHCTAWMRELRGIADLPELFDLALVDVPCSNSGVFARRPEARYHQSEKNLRSLCELQDKILDDTAEVVKTGGAILYSTCSVWPEENLQRIKAFISRRPEWVLQIDSSTLPSFGTDPTKYHDGGFWAVIRKS